MITEEQLKEWEEKWVKTDHIVWENFIDLMQAYREQQKELELIKSSYLYEDYVKRGEMIEEQNRVISGAKSILACKEDRIEELQKEVERLKVEASIVRGVTINGQFYPWEPKR